MDCLDCPLDRFATLRLSLSRLLAEDLMLLLEFVPRDLRGFSLDRFLAGTTGAALSSDLTIIREKLSKAEDILRAG
jgi:hypothetical protein